MDNILLLGFYLTEIRNLKKKLRDKFIIRDIGLMSWYLGIEVIRDQPYRTFYINKSVFMQKILKNLEMKVCKSAKVLIDFRIELVKNVYQR